MKRSIIISLFLLVLLEACSSSESVAQCKKGICVSIKMDTGVKALEPALFTIVVKTEEDVKDLRVSV